MTIPLMYNYDMHTYEKRGSRSAQIDPTGQPVLVSGSATPTPPGPDVAGFAQVWRGKDWLDWPHDAVQQTLESAGTPLAVAAQGVDGSWWYIFDHRQQKDTQGRVIENTGTPYWMPEDMWQSQPNYINGLGPLPDDALLQCPEKPLAAAQTEKMREIAAAHERALAGAVALGDPTPSTVAVESSLLAASDSEGLEWIRDQLAARRTELEVQVQAATSVANIEAIVVSYLV